MIWLDHKGKLWGVINVLDLTIVAIILATLCILTNPSPAYHAGGMNATIPLFEVAINGVQMNKYLRESPVLRYDGTTYIPLTDPYARALGVEYEMDRENKVLKIKNKFNAQQLSEVKGDTHSLSTIFNVKQTDYVIYINDEELHQQEYAYPILEYDGTIFLPVNFNFVYEIFFWVPTWHKDEGINIITQKELIKR